MLGRKMNLLAAFVMSLVFFSCASSNPKYKRINEHAKNKNQSEPLKKLEDIPQFSEREKMMAPGHLFSLFHPTDDRLTGTFRIPMDGILILPYGVKIPASGLTFEELDGKVRASYKSYFKKEVKEMRFHLAKPLYYVEIRGFVKKPGKYLLKRKDSLSKLIDLAGGLNGDGSKDFFSVTLKQQDQNYSISLNQYMENSVYSNSFTWTGGDEVFIKMHEDVGNDQKVPMITIMGAVVHPGKNLYKEDADIFYYLAKSGGVTAGISYDKSFLIRKTKDGVERIKFDLTDISTVPAMYPNDIIMLNADTRSFWDRILNNAAQLATCLTSVAFLIFVL